MRSDEIKVQNNTNHPSIACKTPGCTREAQGGEYCPAHARKSNLMRTERRKYEVSRWKEKIGYYADDDQIKLLNEEIGILRMSLENILQMCKDEDELLIYQPNIITLIDKVTKTIQISHNMEVKLSESLNKATLINLAQKFVDIITVNLEALDLEPEVFEATIRAIADQMAQAVDAAVN